MLVISTNAFAVDVYDTNNANVLSTPIATVNVNATEDQARHGKDLYFRRGCYLDMPSGLGTPHIVECHIGGGFATSDTQMVKLGQSETEGAVGTEE